MTYTVIDQPLLSPGNPQPFALTDVLTAYAGEHHQSFLHFWQLQDTMILGMKDTRVPYLKSGLDALRNIGYTPLVRNSGGLGVINDAGILNVSLIFPKTEEMSITGAYEKMVQFMRQVFPECAIEAYEIKHSYCPGAYDLSVAGKKIAGTAQRRIKDGVAVMMYLSVNGPQVHRGEIVRTFYQTSLQDRFGQDGYPAVDPASMTTLETILNQNISVLDVKNRFTSMLTDPVSHVQLDDWLTQTQQHASLAKRNEAMMQRNQPLKELF